MKKLMVSALTIALAAASFAGCTQTEPVLPGDVSAKPNAAQETVTHTVEEIQNYAESDATIWEFVQDLLPNYIVYKSAGGKFAYSPIDRSLPQSDYNWDNLVEVRTSPREVEYRVDGEKVSLKGIDVSVYQNSIDWQKVAADGVDFAFIRLGYRGYSSGKLVLDEKFAENAAGAIDNGIGTGVYFVTQAVNPQEAVEEANFVIENIKGLDITWPIVIDIEDAASAEARTSLLTQQERTDNAIAFCEKIKEAGYTPMLYCNIRWFIEKLDITRIADYDKWFAQYFRKPFFPYAYQCWQYTNTGRVDGITGNVDMNICFRDYGEQKKGD